MSHTKQSVSYRIVNTKDKLHCPLTRQRERERERQIEKGEAARSDKSKSQVSWSQTPFRRIRAAGYTKRGPAAGKEASLKLGGPRPLFDGYGPLRGQKGVQQQEKKQVSS